jgi:uncharacterized membrane protein
MDDEKGLRKRTVVGTIETLAPRLFVLMVVAWIVVLGVASAYKYETFGQGYDQVDFEQAIWNTTQGRPMEDSRFNFTGSVFGMDWMPMLFLFVPLYALVPSAHVLFIAQIVGSALGAVPLYWLGREKLGSATAGLAAGALYLLYPTLLHTAMNPFQVRLFAVTLLLFAFYNFEKGRWMWALALGLGAMLARTDVSLVVAMAGLYALSTRRSWPWVVAPLALGLGYFALSTFVIVPSFAYPGAFSGPKPAPGEDYMSCWPCGNNPIVAYYGHLGSSGPEIVRYIVTHPVEVAGLMFTGPKLLYMLLLFVPLAFLPLFGPKPLVLALPPLALNLLALRESQFDYESHYSLLMIPGLLVAAVYGAHNVWGLYGRWRERREQAGIKPVVYASLGLAMFALVLTVPYKNPVVRAFTSTESPARVRAANELIAMVPREAHVASSSKLAPRLLPRRYLYNFPPAPYSPYNFGPRTRPGYADLDYVLVDPNASALREEANNLEGRTGLEWLRTLPEWRLVEEREGLQLYRRMPEF